MASRPLHPGLSDIPRPSRTATLAALGVSGLLHGALAATILSWESAPSPYPASPAIVVELVSVAPQPGATTDSGNLASPSTEGKTTGQEPSHGEVAAPASERRPGPPGPPPRLREEQETDAGEPPLPSDDYSADSSSAIEPPMPAATGEIPSTRQEPTPKRTPPPALASAKPPVRPRELQPPRDADPSPVETTFEIPVAEITVETSTSPDVSPDLPGDPLQSPEIEGDISLQTAGLPEDGGATDGSLGDTDGELGGLFSGPSFRLGSAANPLPRYPAIARRRGWEGRVVLRVEVGTDGQPLSVSVTASSDHPALDDAARHTLRSWQFEPARRAGQPVVASVEVPIVFRLRD